MASSMTRLRIRHFPTDLTDNDKEEILKYFGAVQVISLNSKVKRNNIVYASFESENAASRALHQLHQLDVLGHKLCVEYAQESAAKGQTPLLKQNLNLETEEKEKKEEKEKENKKRLQMFLHKLNAWNSSINILQPPPCHLKYQYPPPTKAVLHNICCALASVPKFYTQVLHLMNRMNLPCPFQSDSFPDESNLLAPETSEEKNPAVSMEPLPEEEEESELESDEDSIAVQDYIIPEKRKSQTLRKVKRPKFIKPTQATPVVTAKPVKPEEVFEKAPCEPAQRKIELKLSATSEARRDAEKGNDDNAAGSFGLMFPVAKVSETEAGNFKDEEEEESDIKSDNCITAEELAMNRIASRDQKHLPVFKNYQPGIPSCRLYIKNLSKQVTLGDLHYIYRRYFISHFEEQGSMFDVRLMTEGRMKGQAFITLQNIKLAEKALKETNGYILKDKPLVVQFARSAKAK